MVRTSIRRGPSGASASLRTPLAAARQWPYNGQCGAGPRGPGTVSVRARLRDDDLRAHVQLLVSGIVTISSYIRVFQRSSRTRATQRRGTTSRNVYKKAQHAMTRRHVASRAFLRRCGPGLVASTRYQAATTHTNAMCLCMWAWVCTDSRLQSTQHHLGRPRIH